LVKHVSGIKYLKNLGICHRDIKLENLVLDSNLERLKLIDFGVARRYGHWEQDFKTQESVGTPEIMSPECFYCGEGMKAKRNGILKINNPHYYHGI